MSWEERGQRFTFICDTDGCAKTFTSTSSSQWMPLYEAYVAARAAGWFAVLNKQHCPAHTKGVQSE